MRRCARIFKRWEMAEILRSAPVTAAINEWTRGEAARLRARGTAPTLAIVRVGEKPDDIAYERSAVKRCESLGLDVRCFCLAQEATQEELASLIETINCNGDIHGALLLRPLPKHMDEHAVINKLDVKKDMDGVTDLALADVFSTRGMYCPPCTAQACVEIIRHYGGDIAGKKAVVVGRSLVVGRPLAMLLLKENATVTICHTKTRNLQETCKQADILIAAAGKAGMITADFVREGQMVIDVGINVDVQGNLCGDVDFEAVEPVVASLTPVPGGVGGVTTSILAANTVRSAASTLG